MTNHFLFILENLLMVWESLWPTISILRVASQIDDEHSEYIDHHNTKVTIVTD